MQYSKKNHKEAIEIIRKLEKKLKIDKKEYQEEKHKSKHTN